MLGTHSEINQNQSDECGIGNMPDESKTGERAPDDSSSTKAADEVTSEPRKSRFRPTWVIAAAVLAIGVYFLTVEVHERVNFVFEEDARIHADLITISSRVSGWVTDVPVEQGDRIQKGAVVVQVDDRQSQIVLNELEAQLAGVDAERARLAAEKSLTSAQVDSRLVSEKSRTAAAEVAVSSLRPQLELAKRELDRTRQLFETKVASRRQLDQAETQHQQLDREYRIAVADMTAAQSRIAEVEADRTRLDVLAADLLVLEQRSAEIRARIERQRLDVIDRTVKSPLEGVIDKTFVDAGEYVTPGQRLALAHNPETVWVEANIKETQIRKIAAGQPVQIHVDAYPDETFSGTVNNIGTAATSQFALLPTPNPSGNFTKITQRLPVRINIDNPDLRLHPGMMVEVKIAIQE